MMAILDLLLKGCLIKNIMDESWKVDMLKSLAVSTLTKDPNYVSNSISLFAPHRH